VSEENNNFTDSDPCPDEQELKSYASGEMASTRSGRIIGCHLEFCLSCRSRVEKIRKTEVAVDEAIKGYAENLKRQQEKLVVERWRGPQPGAIWRTIPESDEELLGPMVIVIQVNESGSLSVAEISEDIAQAIHTDMVLEPQASGLRFRFMIRAGNVFETTVDHLKTFAGRLPSRLTNAVVEFCGSAENFDREIPLSKYKFGHDPNGTVLMHRKGITSGVLVTTDNDARISLLDESKRRCSYLALAARESQSEIQQKVIKLRSTKWLVQRILPLAAVLALVVVGVKTLTDRTHDKRAPIQLGTGIATLPFAAEVPAKYLSSSAQTKDLRAFMDSRRDADPQASMELLKRNVQSVEAQPIYYFRPQKKVFSGLGLALFPVPNLSSNRQLEGTWRCDSLLVPLRRFDERIIYQLSEQSLISIALNQSEASLEASLTKSSIAWVTRYFSDHYHNRQPQVPPSSVEDFEKAHKDLYEGIITWLNASGITCSDWLYWNLVVSEIISRYPNEAASTKSRWDSGELKADRRSLPRLVFLTLLTMEAFPELQDDNKFKDFPQVPASYRNAHSRLKRALVNAFGSSYEALKASAEQDALQDLSEYLSRGNYMLKKELTDSEDRPWEDITSWVTFREP
jgi:hypothetical protein